MEKDYLIYHELMKDCYFPCAKQPTEGGRFCLLIYLLFLKKSVTVSKFGLKVTMLFCRLKFFTNFVLLTNPYYLLYILPFRILPPFFAFSFLSAIRTKITQN